ncbi:MAG: transcription-repair coupling factor, partial [Desulfovibrionaceae bacterium]|nr:transcription-repair coupling factor [Desulfovibrionaceae bacterium]
MAHLFPDKLNRFLAGEDQTLRVFKAGPGAAALAAAELWAGGKSVVVLAPGAAEWADLNALLGVFASGGGVIGLPPYRPGLPAAAEWAPRWAALRALVAGPGPKLVLVAVDNLLALWPPRGVAESAFLRLARNEVLCPEIVLDQAADWGYRRVSLATAPGEMAVRGDIFDIFAPGYERPLRLEFFGDALEGIRPFDPLTQRSKAELEEAVILPAAPAVLGADRLAAAKGRLRALKTTGEISAAAESALREALENGDGFISPGLYYPGAVGLEEYLPDRAVYILAAASDLRAGLEDGQWAWREFLAREEAETGRRWPAHLICRTSEGARRVWQGKRQMVLEHLTLGREKQGLDLPERTYASFGDLFWRPEDRKRPWSALTGLLRQRSGSEDRTILCFRSNRSRNRFLELASKEDIPMSLEYSPGGRGVFALVSAFRGGLELDWAGVLVLSEDVLRPESGT